MAGDKRRGMAWPCAGFNLDVFVTHARFDDRAQMRLTDDELRDVLARAEEIQSGSRRGAEWNAEVAAVIGAAEELGLSRVAVERALRERLDLPPAPPAVGDVVWARSTDDKHYVAEVVSTADDTVRVRFMRGGEHALALDEVRPCSFLPGERAVVDWPWWGPWTCSVVSYDPASRYVKLSDGWGDTRTFSIADVWLAPRKIETGPGRSRMRAKLIGVGVAVGAAIGSVVTALLLL
jgi:hypothetical protein